MRANRPARACCACISDERPANRGVACKRAREGVCGARMAATPMPSACSHWPQCSTPPLPRTQALLVPMVHSREGQQRQQHPYPRSPHGFSNWWAGVAWAQSSARGTRCWSDVDGTNTMRARAWPPLLAHKPAKSIFLECPRFSPKREHAAAAAAAARGGASPGPSAEAAERREASAAARGGASPGQHPRRRRRLWAGCTPCTHHHIVDAV
jgi:hypothetical protein